MGGGLGFVGRLYGVLVRMLEVGGKGSARCFVKGFVE